MQTASPRKNRRTLYGSRSENTCAYCGVHKKALTVKQMRGKQCLAKQCSALIKCDHPFWEERGGRKEMRKRRKERLNAMLGGDARAIHTETAPREGDRVSPCE